MTQRPLRLYRALGLDDYELCHTKHAEDLENVIALVNGQPRLATWTPIEMELCRRDMGRRLERSDSPWGHDSALVFRPGVVEALGPILRESGELLPLICDDDDDQLWMFNPRVLAGAFDEDAAKVTRFESGRIMMIHRPAFHADAIGGVHAFKIHAKRVSPTYLAQSFVDAWHAAGLEGLEFTLQWTQSDAAPAPLERA